MKARWPSALAVALILAGPAALACDSSGGDGGYSDENQGYGGGGGRSGDYDGGPGDDCRNACGNTIVVPSPGGSGEPRRASSTAS